MRKLTKEEVALLRETAYATDIYKDDKDMYVECPDCGAEDYVAVGEKRHHLNDFFP